MKIFVLTKVNLKNFTFFDSNNFNITDTLASLSFVKIIQKYEKQSINVFKIVLKLYGKVIFSFNKASNLIAVLIINYI